MSKVSHENVVGSKQTLKALQREEVGVLYLARDAEKKVIEPLEKMAQEKNVETIYMDTMKEVGEEFKIKIGAAAAAKLKQTDGE